MTTPSKPVLVSFGTSIAIFLVCFTASLFAEETYRDITALKRETEAETAAAQAARASQAKSSLEQLEKISFDQILADPDNVELNFQYAQQKVKENDLLGAAGTLERILLINPNLPQIRLFYAVVLFRLDNTSEAEVQLNQLSELQLPDNIQSEVNHYKKLIRSRYKRYHVSIRQSNGYQIDDNRNAAPSSKKRLFLNGLANVDTRSGKEDDSSFLNITSVDAGYDLGFQAGHELIGSFDYFLGEQSKLDNLDIGSIQWDTGIAFKHRWANVTPKFFMNNVQLSRETFLKTVGGSLEMNRKFLKKFEAYSEGRLSYQDYSDIDENLTAHERQGDLLEGKMGLRYSLTRTMTLGLSYLFADKDAKEEFNAYTSHEIGFSHSWLLGKGQFLLSGVGLTRQNYEAPELALAARNRYDKMIRTRVTYGAPLGFFTRGKYLPKMVQDITLTLTYEYFRDISNLTNYTYRNNKYQMMLSKTWEF